MKKILVLLFTCSSFFISKAQEQITDFSERVIDNINFINVGIYKDHYYYILDSEIWKTKLDGITAEIVLQLPKEISPFRAFMDSSDIFISNTHSSQSPITASIFKYNIEKKEFKEVLKLESSNSKLYFLDDQFLYINDFKKISRINILDPDFKEETILIPDSQVFPYISYKHILLKGVWDNSGKSKLGFLDKKQNFQEFTYNGIENQSYRSSQVLENHTIFQTIDYNTKIKDFFIYKKENKHVDRLSLLGDFNDKYIQFFEYNQDLYLLCNQYNFSLKRDVFTLISYKNGILKELFKNDINVKQHFYKKYQDENSTNGDIVYSEPIILDDKLYFIGSPSDSTGYLALVAINLRDSSILQEIFPVNFNYYDDPTFSVIKNRPAFKLREEEDRILIESTSFKESIYEYSTTERNIKENKSLQNYSFLTQEVVKDVSIAFRVPNNLYISTNDIGVAKVEIPEKFHYSSTIRQTITTSENVYFSDYLTNKVWIHSGTGSLTELRLRKGSDDIYKKIIAIQLSKLIDPERILVVVKGVRNDARTTADLYVFDEKTKSIDELYSVNSTGMENVGFYGGTKEFSYSTVLLDDDIVLTNGTKENTVKMGSISNDGYINQIVWQLDKNVLLFQKENNLKLIKVPSLEEIVEVKNQRETGPYINGNDFYLYYDGEAVKRILKNGAIEVLAKITPNEIRFFSYINYQEYVYISTKVIGLINLVSGEHVSFPFDGREFLSQSGVYREGNQILGLTNNTREAFEFDFTAKKSRRIKTFSQPSVYGYADRRKNRVYFIANDTRGNFTISVYSNGVIKEIINGIEGGFDPREPNFFKNTPNGKTLFWNPDKEQVIELPNVKWDFVKDLVYAGKSDGVLCFSKRKDEKETVSCLDLSTLQFYSADIVLKRNEGYYTVNFDDNFFLFANEGVYTVDNKENTISKRSDLEMYDRGNTPLFQFKNNLYLWAYDDLRTPQLFKLTNNESKNIILSNENPIINFSFYPNPTSDFLNINSTSEGSEKYTIRIFSTEGKLLHDYDSTLPEKVNMEELKQGVYLINVTNGKSNTTFRAIKN